METIELEMTRLFVKVIQHGGFSKAAVVLNVPKSTISKAVKRLEADTGTKLLVRTTRSQTLTAAGRLFYETCLGPLQILEDAQKSLFGQDSIVSGKIRLTAPEDLGNYVITPVISRLCLKYPLLDFETMFSNEIVDLVKEGYDLAVRIGGLQQSSLRQRKVGEIEMIPVASPEFLKIHGKISTPKDLEKMDGIVIRTKAMNNQWSFKNEKKTISVKINPRIQGNQMTSIIAAAQAAAGIALVPSYLVAPQLFNGSLIRLLPAWNGKKLPVSMVSPVSMKSSSRLNILTSELVSEFQSAFSV